VLTPDYPPARGGIQLLMERVVRNFDGVDGRVLTLAPPGLGRIDGDSAEVRRSRHLPGLGHAGQVAALNARGLVDALLSAPDVVLSGHVVTSPAALAIHRLTGIPFVQYLHGEEMVARRSLTTLALRDAAAILAVSRHTEELARGCGGDPGRIHRVPPGVDPAPTPAVSRAARPLIVTVAGLSYPYKGHDVLLRALPLIRSRVPGSEWVVVGDGPLRPALERCAEALGVRDAVHFVGAVDDDTRNRWLDMAGVFAMPSRLSARGGGEGFGIAYLEAGAHGLPVVAGDVAGARDAVVDGVTGLLVDPTDHVRVAGAIGDLLLDAGRAASMGRAGAQRAGELTWRRAASRVEEILTTVATTRHPRQPQATAPTWRDRGRGRRRRAR
jgi:phosphatidyl-myo-inositol dimannoside synthase